MEYTREELKLASMTVWCEARGEPREGQIAVAWVIKNRVLAPRWWGTSLTEVILKPWQFSCWRDHEEMRDELEISELVQAVFDGKTPDPTQSCDHYVRTDWVSRTSWAKGRRPKCVIGSHSFFRLEL